jgi:hypothetical protein
MVARSEVILRAAILKESKVSLRGELLDSEGEGNFCVAGSFLFGERSITVVPFCLGKASRVDGRAIDEKAGAKEVIDTRGLFSRRN